MQGAGRRCTSGSSRGSNREGGSGSRGAKTGEGAEGGSRKTLLFLGLSVLPSGSGGLARRGRVEQVVTRQ